MIEDIMLIWCNGQNWKSKLGLFQPNRMENLVLEELSEINLCTMQKAHPNAEKTLHLLIFTNPKGTAEKNNDHPKALADWAKTWLVYRQN